MNGPISKMNPFPGLRPFTQEEDYLFFGREEQTIELLQRLGTNRFVAVVGTSGSGKSSLVRCGLLSEVLGGKMLQAGASWEIAVTHPGGNPLALLVDALVEADLYDAEEEHVRENLLATLNRSHFGLVEAVKQAGLGEDTNFLLVVDQFEEIFRFHEAGQTQREMANEFVSILLESVAQSEVPIYVVLTMRSDFIGECGQFEGLAEMVNRGEFLIPRLSREQYKRVIEGPIKVAGGKIAPRLLQRLLNDLGQQADQLPCLQHALMRTWDVWAQRGDSEALDLDDYQRVGKMSQALSLHADEIYDSLASEREKELCEGMFQALTVQESSGRGIRRPQRLGSLCQILEVEADELKPVIDAYRAHGVTFLMPSPDVELTEQTIIDISHESLMRVWTRLKRWVEEEAQAVGIYRRLSESAQLHAQGEAGLYRDPELSIAQSWRTARPRNQAWAERYHPGFAAAISFLEESDAAAQRADLEREAARQHELEQARELAAAQQLRAEEQKRAAVRLKWLAGALTGVAAMALVAFAMAASARKSAEENEALALKSQAEAMSAAGTAELAREQAETARDDAQRAGEEEAKQRLAAETAGRELATALQQESVAREDAEQARRKAEESQRLAEQSLQRAEVAEATAKQERTLAQQAQRQAEEDRIRAETAGLQAVNDRKRAEREKLLAEQSAELARRRELLFEKLLPLLQDHASEGVLKYAAQLERAGQSMEALSTFAEFADLTLGDNQGFLASQLLDLGTLELEGLNTDVMEVQVSVPPGSLFRQVLEPGIRHGENLLKKTEDPAPVRNDLAKLLAARARLLQQHPDQQWPDDVVPAEMIFQSYDRAASLQPQNYRHYLGRAGARFRTATPDYDESLTDLETAIAMFPDPPQPTEDADRVTDVHREFAQLHDARANVLEYMAERADPQQAETLLRESEQAHRFAQSLDPQNMRYPVGVARTLRKQVSQMPSADADPQLIAGKEILDSVLETQPELPAAHNELGEIYLSHGQLDEARKAFGMAVKFGEQTARNNSRYVYYCNLANAQTREPANAESYQIGLKAAEKAIDLDVDNPVDALYYRGFALWKLGQTEEAMGAFSKVLDVDGAHVETLLARSQIVFEMKPPNEASQAQIARAYADASRVLETPNLNREEKAKAEYVNSLGWLRRHINDRSERALVECQRLALTASLAAPAYRSFAQQIFEYAAGRDWQDTALRADSRKLQQELQVAFDSGGE